jgi:DNA polymerase III subunit delta
MVKNQCILIHGADQYRSEKAVKAIKQRFLAKQDSMSDLITYDLEQVSLETLKQALLTIPFLVSHRLFILRHAFLAPKATLDGLVPLLSQIAPSTVVVFYETKPADKRFSLYQWLTKHATVQTYNVPIGTVLTEWIITLGQGYGVTITMPAARLLAEYYGQDTLRLAQEIQKIANYSCSLRQERVDESSVAALCAPESDSAIFRLTDALRERNVTAGISLFRQIITQEDPILITATLASHIRTIAKIWLCLHQNITTASAIAQAAKLNPFVVKLALPLARRLTQSRLNQAYRHLVWADSGLKDGSLSGEVGVLLLIVRLHDTLNIRPM